MAYPGGAYPSGGQRVTWVASPPGHFGAPPARPRTFRLPYFGPPAYPAAPRWGFPRLAWRPPTVVPGTPTRSPRSEAQVVRASRPAVSLLWMVAISALLACGGEVWRYVLLVRGRDHTVGGDLVAVSDALVLTGALLAAVSGVVALALVLRWLLMIREVAGDVAGVRPARPDWQVLLGVLAPGLNLFVAGAVLAEVEDTILGPTDTRPRPSRLVLLWWAVWAGAELLAVLTLLLGLRSGVQAEADGVLWHAATDLVAAGSAVLTGLVVASLTALVAPALARGTHRMRVLSISGAPEPPLRAHRPTGATR